MKERLLQVFGPCNAPLDYDYVTINGEKSTVIKGKLFRSLYLDRKRRHFDGKLLSGWKQGLKGFSSTDDRNTSKSFFIWFAFSFTFGR